MAPKEPIRLAEQGDGPRLEIAPLTVTIGREQMFTSGCGPFWHWHQSVRWTDPDTGWSGIWAFEEYSHIRRAVRLRIIEGWPAVSSAELATALQGAMGGIRPATVRDDERMLAELSAAPVGPVEGMEATVSAQLHALVSGR